MVMKFFLRLSVFTLNNIRRPKPVIHVKDIITIWDIIQIVLSMWLAQNKDVRLPNF